MHALPLAAAPGLAAGIAWAFAGVVLTSGMIVALWRWTLAERAARCDDQPVRPPTDGPP